MEIKGRFAPSPTGRMHLGNIYTALLSWLSVRRQGGSWILRIEDLDPQRSKYEYARQIEDDLDWLGLDWDEGGLDDRGPSGPYSQSRRHDIYEAALAKLLDTGYCYPCRCRRADILATQAPHQSDGRIIYGGTCRPAVLPTPWSGLADRSAGAAVRLYVPGDIIDFDDLVYGHQEVALDSHCGDFILRRADGAWAYQLAVVVDDATMGVTEVMRGNDLLLSSAQQIYLYRLLGYESPRFAHLPLIVNESGIRLSKRDASLSMVELRRRYTAPKLIGLIARMAGLTPDATPITPRDLIPAFTLATIPAVESITADQKV